MLAIHAITRAMGKDGHDAARRREMEREERLAEQLRANLRRRKEQARAQRKPDQATD